MISFAHFIDTFISTISDVVPIATIIFGFQLAVLRRPVSNLPKVILGFGYVILGLSLFLLGLEMALFPLGETMATQLTAPDFLREFKVSIGQALSWVDYYWAHPLTGKQAAKSSFVISIGEDQLDFISVFLFHLVVIEIIHMNFRNV